ncbi:hypothetical protein TRIP_D380029 [uncultured Paludibacter sp.]|nr:hypothetical protein TRIP_D380029 [uncultured Paludibacter sp.]
MKNLYFKILVGIFGIYLISCNGNSPVPPYVYETNPQYTWGFAQFYGAYYSNYEIQDNVLTLNLLTDKLGVDSLNQLTGTGQYLILEDVFTNSADTLLPEGTYTAVDTITDIKPFTFLKGKEFKENSSSDGIPSGAYVYYFEEDASKDVIKYIVSGSFTVSYNLQNDNYTINCDFTTKDKKNIKGTFTEELPHFDLSAKIKAGMTREKIFKINW